MDATALFSTAATDRTLNADITHDSFETVEHRDDCRFKSPPGRNTVSSPCTHHKQERRLGYETSEKVVTLRKQQAEKEAKLHSALKAAQTRRILFCQQDEGSNSKEQANTSSNTPSEQQVIGKNDPWERVKTIVFDGWKCKKCSKLGIDYRYGPPGGKGPKEGGVRGKDYVNFYEEFEWKKYAVDHKGWGGDDDFHKENENRKRPSTERRRSRRSKLSISTKNTGEPPSQQVQLISPDSDANATHQSLTGTKRRAETKKAGTKRPKSQKCKATVGSAGSTTSPSRKKFKSAKDSKSKIAGSWIDSIEELTIHRDDRHGYVKRLVDDGFDTKQMLAKIKESDLLFMKKAHRAQVVHWLNKTKYEAVKEWIQSALPDLHSDDEAEYVNQLINEGLDSEDRLKELTQEDLCFMKRKHKEAALQLLQ